MSEIEEDELVIKVVTENDGAIKGIEDVQTALKNLDGSIGANGTFKLTELANSLKAINGISYKIKNLSNVVGTFNNLGNIDYDHISEGVTHVAGSFDALKNSLTGMRKSTNAVESLTASLSVLPGALSTFPDSSTFTTRIGSIKQTLDGLADASKNGSQYGNGVLAMARGIQKLPDAISGMSNIDQGSLQTAAGNVNSFVNSIISSLTQLDSFKHSPTSGFSNIAQGLKALSNAGADSNLTANLEKAKAGIIDFTTSLSTSVPDEVVGKLSSLGSAVKNISDAYRGLQNKVGTVSNSLAKSGDSASLSKQSLNGILTGLTALNTGLSDFGKNSGISGYFNGFVTGISNVSPMMGMFFGEASHVFSEIGNVATENAPLLKRALDLISIAAAGATRIIVNLAGMPFKNLANGIQNVSKSLKTLQGRIARVIMMRAIRGVITQVIDGLKTGVTNLYFWAKAVGDSFAASMNSMATEMQYFKNSIGAMVSPLLTALAPALEFIIDECVRAINAINQLFSALTGATTWRKAIKQQKDFATATGGSSKAVKELKNSLLGFDEINALQDNNSSSGGGGKTQPNYSGMFETEPIENKWKDLANSDDWTKLGEQIADKLNSWEKSIDWDSIDKTAETWSKRVYTSFNGSIHERDWGSLGYTIARGINVGLHFVDTIAQKTDWTAFGSGLATSLNKTVETLDWQALGRTLTDGIKVAAETLHGFTTTFDWSGLRDGLSAGIKSAFSNVNWGHLIFDVVTTGSEILETLKTVIASIPWSEIGNAIQNAPWGELISNALDLIGTIIISLSDAKLMGVIMPALGGKVGFMIGGIFGHPAICAAIGVGIGLIAGLVMDHWGAIKNAVSSGFDFIKNLIDGDMKIIVSITMAPLQFIYLTFRGIIDSVVNSVNTFFSGITNIVSGALTLLKGVMAGNFNDIRNGTSEIWNGIKNVIVAPINLLAGLVMAPINALKSVMLNVFYTIYTETSNQFSIIKNAITGPIEDAKNIISRILNQILGFFSGLKIKFPKIEMPELPHFSLNGSFSLAPPKVPVLKVDWYAKAMDKGMILNTPTMFGMTKDGTALAGGEAGSEVVVGQRSLLGIINDTVQKATTVSARNISETIVGAMQSVSPATGDTRPIEIPIYLDGEELYRGVIRGRDNVQMRYHTV